MSNLSRSKRDVVRCACGLRVCLRHPAMPGRPAEILGVSRHRKVAHSWTGDFLIASQDIAILCSGRCQSELDSTLAEAYAGAARRVDQVGARQLANGQRQWLRNIRSRCADVNCLLKRYKSRIDELDPFADKKLTCDEMRKYPGRIFSSGLIDLGSGSGSPIDVDYRCPESLSQQKFMQLRYSGTAPTPPSKASSLSF